MEDRTVATKRRKRNEKIFQISLNTRTDALYLAVCAVTACASHALSLFLCHADTHCAQKHFNFYVGWRLVMRVSEHIVRIPTRTPFSMQWTIKFSKHTIHAYELTRHLIQQKEFCFIKITSWICGSVCDFLESIQIGWDGLYRRTEKKEKKRNEKHYLFHNCRDQDTDWSTQILHRALKSGTICCSSVKKLCCRRASLAVVGVPCQSRKIVSAQRCGNNWYFRLNYLAVIFIRQ